jgi:hypothetical protein
MEPVVENHVRNILAKLHLSRKQELIRYAVEHCIEERVQPGLGGAPDIGAGPAARPLVVGVATALLSIGVFGIASTNLADVFANKPVDLAVVSLTPVMLTLGTVAGIALSKRAVR